MVAKEALLVEPQEAPADAQMVQSWSESPARVVDPVPPSPAGLQAREPVEPVPVDLPTCSVLGGDWLWFGG